MTAIADPTNSNSTHHVVLTNGATSVGLILCDASGKANALGGMRRDPIDPTGIKVYSDQQKYSDFLMPWSPVSQDDWAGGRGSKDFDRDKTMYFDGYGVNTLREGEIILGPKATETAGTGTTWTNTRNQGAMYEMYTEIGAGWYAMQFTPNASGTIVSLELVLWCDIPRPAGQTFNVGLAPVSGGNPGSITWASNPVQPTETFGATRRSFTISFEFVSGTPYFIVLTGPTWNDAFTVANSTTDLASIKYSSDSGSNWSTITASYHVPYIITYGTVANKLKAHFFEYKNALYRVSQFDDGSYSKLFVNGDHGVAKTGSTTTSITLDSGVATWAADEAIGSILVIARGDGTGQPQNWRVITDNGATTAGETTFTVEAFDRAPAAGATIAIIASDKWTEITAFDDNYNVIVTDVLPVNGVVYFANGDSTAMVRMYAYNSSGTWTYNFSDLGAYTDGSVAETGAFTHLAYASDEDGTYIWGAKANASAQINYASPVDGTAWAGSGEAALTWQTGAKIIYVGDRGDRIVGLEIYDEFGSLHVFKETGIWRIYKKRPYRIDIRELGNTRDDRNGVAHLVQGVYLYFSWHNTVVRWFNGTLDRIGPDKAEVAIPTGNRHGNFSAIAGYPGVVFGGVDAGPTGISTVLAYNQRGWCELYRGASGARIQNLYVQSIPGNAVDRLWVSIGTGVVWLPLSIDPYNHPSDAYNPYLYESEGYLITAWYYLGLNEIEKLFNSIRLVVENASATETVTVAYQVDDDSAWTDISGTVDTFSEKLYLAATPSVTGRRIRFRYRLASTTGTATPRVITTVLDAITRVPTKYTTTLTFRVADGDHDLNGDPDDYQTAAAKIAAIEAMRDLTIPVTISSVLSQLNGGSAFVSSPTLTPYQLHTETGYVEGYIGQLVLIDVE